MKEQEDFQKRFRVAREYWQNAVNEGRLYKSQFYQEIFESPETYLYEESADDDMIFLIARTLNETWVGVNKEGIVDDNNH